jgi:hypothetical protein
MIDMILSCWIMVANDREKEKRCGYRGKREG